MSDAQTRGWGFDVWALPPQTAVGPGRDGRVYEAEHRQGGVTVATVDDRGNSRTRCFASGPNAKPASPAGCRNSRVVPIHDYGEVDGQMF